MNELVELIRRYQNELDIHLSAEQDDWDEGYDAALHSVVVDLSLIITKKLDEPSSSP